MDAQEHGSRRAWLSGLLASIFGAWTVSGRPRAGRVRRHADRVGPSVGSSWVYRYDVDGNLVFRGLTVEA